jgi:hypothetical protein
MFSTSGDESTHGGHHVAQKSTKTTFPFKSARESAFPLISVRLKAGACTRDTPDEVAVSDATAVAPWLRHPVVDQEIKKRQRHNNRDFCFGFMAKKQLCGFFEATFI